MGRPRKKVEEVQEIVDLQGVENTAETNTEPGISEDAVKTEKEPYSDFVYQIYINRSEASYTKIEDFAKALVVKWTREIERLKNRFSATQIECSEELDLLDEKISDAKEDFNYAWYDVPETALESKDAQRTFMVTYENNIDSKLDKLNNLETQKAKIIVEYENKLSDILAEVEEIQRRINKVKN